MKKIVLDSFALLAYFEDEPGGKLVKDILQRGRKRKTQLFLSYINLAEVYYRTIRDHGILQAKRTLSTIKRMPIKLISATDEFVLKAAEIKAAYPIALGDCFAAALALQEKASILTGDPEFKKLGKAVKIKWLSADGRVL